MSFTSVTAAAFDSTLTPKGFVKTLANKEVVFTRAHDKNPDFKIMVYSSLTDGASEVREVGSDAIRVCLVYTHNGKTHGIGKSKRVYREGEEKRIMERMVERAREMYILANKTMKGGLCSCGSPRWEDSGRCMARCGK